MPALTSATIGFPRIGPKREMKKALEDYWAGKSSEADLIATSHAIEAAAWTAQADAGIDLIALDGTLYDQILDFTDYLGLIPERFNALSGLDRYFAAARGTTTSTALDMSKYFDTNYHQIVPELNSTSTPIPNWTPLFDRVRRGQAVVGAAKAVPLLVGPLTFVALSRGDFNASEMVQRLVPAYVEALHELTKLGVPEVQVSILSIDYQKKIHQRAIRSLLRFSFFFFLFVQNLHHRPVGVGFWGSTLPSFLHSINFLSASARFAFISRSRLCCCTFFLYHFFFLSRDPWLIWKALLYYRRRIRFESGRELYDNTSFEIYRKI